jgi:hypothetical protein
MSSGTNLQMLGAYTGRILKGAKPAGKAGAVTCAMTSDNCATVGVSDNGRAREHPASLAYASMTIALRVPSFAH